MSIDQRTIEILSQVVFKEHSTKFGLPGDNDEERKKYFLRVEKDTRELANAIYRIIKPKK